MSDCLTGLKSPTGPHVPSRFQPKATSRESKHMPSRNASQKLPERYLCLVPTSSGTERENDDSEKRVVQRILSGFQGSTSRPSHLDP